MDVEELFFLVVEYAAFTVNANTPIVHSSLLHHIGPERANVIIGNY